MVEIMAANVFAFMLLGHDYSSAWQQVLNKDIEYKSYSKAQLKMSFGTEADRITGAEGRVNVWPNSINADVSGRLCVALKVIYEQLCSYVLVAISD